MSDASIKEPTLRELAEARSLSGVVAVGQRGGYTIVVNNSMRDAQRRLITARGETRLFSSLNTLANYLLKIGVSRFEVDTSDYEQARLRAARPDRAQAMKLTRTAPRQAPLEFTKEKL